MKTLEWVKGLELAGGGIAAWTEGPAYPEVSGYLIPTLYDYGERELALRLAEWLLTVQNKDGSFPDMSGERRTFDTSACMEGLERARAESGELRFARAVDKARGWLRSMVMEDGAMRTTPGSEATHFYTMRASWLIQSQAGADYWLSNEMDKDRSHYRAYGMEGLLGMGYNGVVREILKRDKIDAELCATAQYAILYHKVQLDARPLIEAVEGWSELLKNSWTAKWVLDMWKAVL